MKKLFITLIFFISLIAIYYSFVPEGDTSNGKKEVSGVNLLNKIKEIPLAEKQKNEVEKKVVKVDQLVRESIGESLKLTGLISPEEVYNIHTEATIIIKEVLVNEGDKIKKGDKLLTFEGSYREEILRQLKSIKLDIDNARLELKNMSSGSLQLELDNKKLEIREVRDSIKGLNKKKSVIQFELKNLKEEAAVKEELLRQDGISSIEANRARTEAYNKELEYEDVIRELEITKKRYDLLLLGYNRLEKELRFKESTLKSRISKLSLEREQKRVELSKQKSEIKAPVSGIVTELLAESGGVSDPRTKLMSITPFDKIVIKINVPVDDAKRLNIGTRATITMKDSQSKSYTGRVSKISNIAKEDYTGRMVEVEIAIDSNDRLTPGEAVVVEVFSTDKSNALTVNSFSVFQQNGKDYVYVVENGKIIKKEIEVGVRTLSKYEVLNLEDGMNVIMYPYNVKDGETVYLE